MDCRFIHCRAPLALAFLLAAAAPGFGEGRGPSGGQGQHGGQVVDGAERGRPGGGNPGEPAAGRIGNIAHGQGGFSPNLAGPAASRIGALSPLAQDAFLIGMEKYLLKGAPIQTEPDLQYIQNHLGGIVPKAPDMPLQPAPKGKASSLAADPGGGGVLASPDKGLAPWEAVVNRKLIDVDGNDAYARRVAGIQDSFNAAYKPALAHLHSAINDGYKDPTATAFGALAAFHRNDMKDAANWAQKSLDKAPEGPWSKLADSVLKLTRSKVANAADPKASPSAGLSRGPEAPRGAVGPALFPNQVGEGGGGTGDSLEAKVKDAQRALKLGDYARAEELAGQILADDPSNAAALKVRASTELFTKRYNPAFKDADKALEKVPQDEELLKTRGLAAARTGQFSQAMVDALAILRADPRSSAGLRLLALAEAGKGDHAAAMAALTRAAAVDPAAAELLRRAGELPAGADAMALFSDALVLGEGQTAQAAAASAARGKLPAERVLADSLIGLGMVILTALFAGGAWLAWSRRPKPAPMGALDLSEFNRRKTPRPVTMPSSAPPATVGPFRVLGTLGTGGMGVIYKAQDTGLDRVVALKRMRDEIAEDPRERKRFLKEAQIVSRLDHPGIVRIYSIQEEPEGLYLVFEYVEGRTLSDAIRLQGRLSPADARAYAVQAAEAVAYAHAQGVVHRDLKPANIMVDKAGRVRVMDFGVARAAKDAITRLTAQGTVSGTPAYMAPEQEDGRTSPATDVYALGVCLYEMLTGKPPFEGTGLTLYKAKRAGAPRPLAASLGAAAPAGLDAVLARALEPDPARRFASAHDLAAALDAVPV